MQTPTPYLGVRLLSALLGGLTSKLGDVHLENLIRVHIIKVHFFEFENFFF